MKKGEMGLKEGSDNPTADVNSSVSISLLRERFKQLQKLKEMREERDPLRLINKAANYKVSGHPRHDLSSRYVIPRERKLYPNIVAPSSPTPLSISLGWNEVAEELRRWHSKNARPASPALFIDLVGRDDDVDTSLRL